MHLVFAMNFSRFTILIAVPLFLVFSTGGSSLATPEVQTASEINKSKRTFSANWPAERPAGESLPIFKSYNCSGGNSPPIHFAYWIHSYFEPKNLSEKAKAQLRLEIKTKNWKNWYKLWTTNCTPADIFYIEQVIWEASPFACTDGATSPGKWRLSYKGLEVITPYQRRKKNVKPLHEPMIAGRPSLSLKNYVLGRIKSGEGLCNNFSCEALYRKEHPEVTSEIVVMHFIPLNAAQTFSTAIEQNELHSLKNLKALEPSKFNSKQLDAFRDEWTEFLKSPANTMNRQMVLTEADRLESKYQALFVQ